MCQTPECFFPFTVKLPHWKLRNMISDWFLFYIFRYEFVLQTQIRRETKTRSRRDSARKHIQLVLDFHHYIPTLNDKRIKNIHWPDAAFDCWGGASIMLNCLLSFAIWACTWQRGIDNKNWIPEIAHDIMIQIY